MTTFARPFDFGVTTATLVFCTAVMAGQPDLPSMFEANATCVYPQTALGQELFLCVSYSNRMGMPLVWQAPFDITRHPAELGIVIYGPTSLVRKVKRAYSSPSMGNGPHEQAPYSMLLRDVVIPPAELPASTGVYTLVVSVAAFRDAIGLHQLAPVRLPALRFELVSPGTPTPERPRPWKEYEDPALYPELKRFLLAMPIHRFEQAGLSGKVRLEVFCDADFPKEKRLAKFDVLMFHQRPHTEQLLPLALDEKTDEDIRLRAMMLLGGMENNEVAKKELIKRFWCKDDAGKRSALFRLAFLYGGGGEIPISYGLVDPSPLVRAFGLWSAGRRYRGEECIQIAKTLTDCVEKMPVEIFTDMRPSLSQKDIGTYARDSIAGWERMFREPWPSDRPKPVPPPADAAEQAEAVRKLFH